MYQSGAEGVHQCWIWGELEMSIGLQRCLAGIRVPTEVSKQENSMLRCVFFFFSWQIMDSDLQEKRMGMRRSKMVSMNLSGPQRG